MKTVTSMDVSKKSINHPQLTLQHRNLDYGWTAGLPDFSWFKPTKTGKIHKMTANYTKRPYIIPNDLKIFQMIIKYNHIFHYKSNQNLPE
jgi:hypothetical protein